jgi:hypothetical protein
VVFPNVSALPILFFWALSSQSAPVEQAQNIPTFQQFRLAQIYRGKPAKPIFRTKEELEFRTRIREGAANGPNFAGHYAVVIWGGGTGTGTFVLVDVKSGQIFFHVDPKRGIEFYFQLNSRLMVIDGCDSPPGDGPCVRSFWEWSGKEMKFLTSFSSASSLACRRATSCRDKRTSKKQSVESKRQNRAQHALMTVTGRRVLRG